MLKILRKKEIEKNISEGNRRNQGVKLLEGLLGNVQDKEQQRSILGSVLRVQTEDAVEEITYTDAETVNEGKMCEALIQSLMEKKKKNTREFYEEL